MSDTTTEPVAGEDIVMSLAAGGLTVSKRVRRTLVRASRTTSTRNGHPAPANGERHQDWVRRPPRWRNRRNASSIK